LINFGGELIDNDGNPHTSSEMGSGRFPYEGYQHAAYIRKIQYVNLSGQMLDANYLFGYATVPQCWDIGDIDYSNQSDWRTNFFFGGACNAGDDDDDDNDDNDDNDDDNDGNDDDNDDGESYCFDLVDLIYNRCGSHLFKGGASMSGDEAYALCQSGGETWDCLYECSRNSQVDSCATLSECFESQCNIRTSGKKDNKNDSGGKSNIGCG